MGDTLLTPLVRWLPAAVLVFASASPAAATVPPASYSARVPRTSVSTWPPVTPTASFSTG